MKTEPEPPFLTWKQALIARYGKPLYRVPIDAGFGCPHRHKDGSGGCSFCPGDGSRAKYTSEAITIGEQIQAGAAFVRRRYDAEKFMAYIQAYTGTNAPVSEQKEVYDQVLSAFDFAALSIGTRPDCLPGPVLLLLEEINAKTDLWIELGVQTVHDRTLRRVNRGHGWVESSEAIHSLHERGIKVIAHVIIGLPGEGREDFALTAEALAHMPISGIKIHNLHVVKGTTLADEFATNRFKVYDEYEYADILIDFLRRLPAVIPIVRINTDTTPNELIAPVWSMKKGRFRQYVESEMIRRGVKQGDIGS